MTEQLDMFAAPPVVALTPASHAWWLMGANETLEQWRERTNDEYEREFAEENLRCPGCGSPLVRCVRHQQRAVDGENIYPADKDTHPTCLARRANCGQRMRRAA